MKKPHISIELNINADYQKSRNEFAIVSEEETGIVILLACLRDQKVVQIYANSILLNDLSLISQGITEIYGDDKEDFDHKSIMNEILNKVTDSNFVDVKNYVELKLIRTNILPN